MAENEPAGRGFQRFCHRVECRVRIDAFAQSLPDFCDDWVDHAGQVRDLDRQLFATGWIDLGCGAFNALGIDVIECYVIETRDQVGQRYFSARAGSQHDRSSRHGLLRGA